MQYTRAVETVHDGEPHGGFMCTKTLIITLEQCKTIVLWGPMHTRKMVKYYD